MPLSLLLEASGKRQRREKLAPSPPPRISALEPLSSPSSSKGGLLYLRDDLSGQEFLVDTGAAVSLIPCQLSAPPGPRRLRQADGSTLPSWGRRIVPLQFGGHTFSWPFLLAAVDRPIIGADFIAKNSWVVDLDGMQILDGKTMAPIFSAPWVDDLHNNTEDFTGLVTLDPRISSLLSEFSDIRGASFSDIKPQHGVEHHILTTGPPVHARFRRLDPVKLEAAKAEFRRMEEAGIIRRSTSPWSSPLHMVPKPDGSWRPCGDYRALNNATVPDRYPVPHIHDFTSRLSGCKVFTKLDLVKGYYQVPVAEADIPKTCVITPFGAFEWLFMPFGLRNAGNTFQRMMDRLGIDLPFVFIYLDDILIASKDFETHLHHLRLVLERLRSFGLVINPAKCLFAQQEVPFLGHLVSASGITPLLRHVEAVKNFPPPTDKQSLQRYLGLVNFFRRFLPAAALMLKPLTDALRSTTSSWSWTPQMQSAFEASRSALAEAATLRHPRPGAPVSLAVDASAHHIGAVLQQLEGSNWAPLAFYSRKLSEAEQKYSTFDRELLAAYAAVRHFQFFLEGRQFALLTDHKPLTAALRRTSSPLSARQQRHLSYLAEFTSDIRHLPGSANPVADALSRPSPPPATVSAIASTPSLMPFLDPLVLSAAQQACADCSAIASDPKFQVRAKDGVLYAFSGAEPRLLLPPAFRRQAFKEVHSLAHPGMRSSRRLMSRRFIWPAMNKDVNTWSRECQDCQVSKIHRHQRAPVEEIPVPVRRFSHVHLDLVGPLKSSGGYTSVLTIVDRSTRWPEAVPLADTSARTVFSAFTRHWISRFGVPSTLTTDRGVQFTSNVWADFCKELGINHILTTAFHPQSNGMVERMHRRLKDALRARGASLSWAEELPWVLLGMRMTPREDSAMSPSEAVYGSTLSAPSAFLDVREQPAEGFCQRLVRLMDHLPLPSPRHNAAPPSRIDDRLNSASHVFVRRDGHVPPLEPLYAGPYEVLQRGPKVFRLRLGSKEDSISVDRLKPCISSSIVRAASPPRRGRPPKPTQPTSPAPASRRPRGRPRRVQADQPSPSTPPALRRSTRRAAGLGGSCGAPA